MDNNQSDFPQARKTINQASYSNGIRPHVEKEKLSIRPHVEKEK